MKKQIIKTKFKGNNTIGYIIFPLEISVDINHRIMGSPIFDLPISGIYDKETIEMYFGKNKTTDWGGSKVTYAKVVLKGDISINNVLYK